MFILFSIYINKCKLHIAVAVAVAKLVARLVKVARLIAVAVAKLAAVAMLIAIIVESREEEWVVHT
jgi:hypothetical protein